MRVRLIRGEDDGAIAVLVALLAVVLIGMAAFAVDLGNAYAVKRKLSVTADAAAIAGVSAASKVLRAGAVSCDTATGKITPAAQQTAAQAAAQTAASAVMSQGDLSGKSTLTPVVLSCTADDLRLTVSNAQSVPTFFAGIFGIGDTNPVGGATARAFVPGSGTGLKPIAACTDTVNSRYNPSGPSKPFLVFMDNNGNPCGVGANGNWGILNFDDQGQYNAAPTGPFDDPNCASGGSATCQALWMSTGYYDRVYVPNPSPWVANPANRVAGKPGLGGSTGQGVGNEFKTALESMPGKVISLPVAAWVSGNGNNAKFGITGIVSARVCAVRSQNSYYTDPSPYSGECDNAVSGPPNRVPYNTNLPNQTISEYTWWTTGNNKYALWVEPVDYITTGSSDPRGGCLFVSGCDFNTRAVQLYN
jgi:Flp pilus assembly protein TadG